LDNSRSTGAVTFLVDATGFGTEVEFHLAAGATEVVRIPVSEGSTVHVSVYAYDPVDDFGMAQLVDSSMRVVCMLDEPRASIGPVNCSSYTVPITLDNSRSLSETIFWIFDESRETEEDFAVPAGGTQTVDFAVTEDSFGAVLVSLASSLHGEGDPLLAEESFDVDCAPRQGITTATVGDFDCKSRTIRITIDNSGVNRATKVGLLAESELDSYDLFDEDVEVASGAIRIVRVSIPRFAQRVYAYVWNFDSQTTLDDGILAYRTIHINCPSTAARPTVAVKDAKLPQTGGFNLAIPLLGAALLTGGASMLALSGRRRQPPSTVPCIVRRDEIGNTFRKQPSP
jgi:LPXTG-motif cell wall-anchored protein